MVPLLSEEGRTTLVTSRSSGRDVTPGRPVDACSLCLLRTIVEQATFRGTAATTTEGADLIGKRAEVPDPCYDGPTEEYAEGDDGDLRTRRAGRVDVDHLALDEERVALPLTCVRFVD